MAGEKTEEKSIQTPSYIIPIVYVLIFAYSNCYYIQVNALPFLVKQFDIDVVGYAYIQTFFSIIQLIGSPLYGRFSDLYGAKMSLLITFISSILTYSTLAIANSVIFIYFSMIFGLLMGGMQGCQMVISDVTTEENRVITLGRLYASYSLGLITGSLTSGYIVKFFSPQFAAIIAAIFSIIPIPIILYFIPSFVKSQHARLTSNKNENFFDLKPWLHVLRLPGVLSLFLLCTLAGLPTAMWRSLSAMISIDIFHIEAQYFGWLMAYNGIISMVVYTFCLPYITTKFRDNDFQIILGAITLKGVVYAILGFIENVYLYCLLIIPLVGSDSIFSSFISSVLIKLVPEASTGLALGIYMTLMTLVSTVASLIGGYLLKYIGFCGMMSIAAFIELIAVFYITCI